MTVLYEVREDDGRTTGDDVYTDWMAVLHRARDLLDHNVPRCYYILARDTFGGDVWTAGCVHADGCGHNAGMLEKWSRNYPGAPRLTREGFVRGPDDPPPPVLDLHLPAKRPARRGRKRAMR